MSLGVNALKTVARRASVAALVKYDQLEDAVLGLIAQTVAPNGRQKVQEIEWADAFALMREWISERKVRTVMRSAIQITLKAFELTFELDRMDLELDGEHALIKAPEDLAMQFVKGFDQGKLQHAYEPLRQNLVTTYDGQNIFDTDHLHPDGDVFSNVVDLSDEGYSRGSTGKPTATEAKTELELAIDRLNKNQIRLQSLVRVGTPELTVVAKSFDVFKGYHDLLTQDVIANTTNTWKGKFELLRDFAPKAGDEKKVDVIASVPGGPRPSIFIPVKEPSGIEVDLTKDFSHRKIPFGSDAIFGFGAGLPQPAVRIQE